MTTTIERRDVRLALDPAAIPRDWCAGDPYATTFLNSLSMLFPEGERFFIDTVKAHRDLAPPEQHDAIREFIGQEAMHGREHQAFNELLAAHGYRQAPAVDARLRWFLRLVRRVLGSKSQLAVTCALEHFTAMLAEQMLDTPKIQAELHPAVRPLWLWHCLEESEHKSVAYDLYRAVGGGYVRRIWIMLLPTFFFFVIQGSLHVRLMAARGILWRPWTWPRGIVRMWIWPGYFTRLVPAYFSYYRPRFHPADRDNTALTARWREALFGPAGVLAGSIE